MPSTFYIYIIMFAGFALNGLGTFIAILRLATMIEHRLTRLETHMDSLLGRRNTDK